MLVLLKFTIFHPMEAIFNFPVARNQIVEGRSRNRIGIKTRYKISGFVRLKYAATTVYFRNTAVSRRINARQPGMPSSSRTNSAAHFFTHKDRLITQPFFYRPFGRLQVHSPRFQILVSFDRAYCIFGNTALIVFYLYQIIPVIFLNRFQQRTLGVDGIAGQ